MAREMGCDGPSDFDLWESELQGEQLYLDELRLLTEVDHLNRLRLPDGRHSPLAIEGVRRNLIPGTKEAAMPYAVSTTYQEYADGHYWWMDQTPEQVAASGYRFHEHPSALARVAVEVDEARDLDSLHPGMIKVFISPRMSAKDAPYEVAKGEHLSDDDMIRIHMVDMGPDGQPKGKYMQSVLVRDIPLSAWVAMLRDPNNIFGKSIMVEDEASALSVMKVYEDLEVPEAVLPKGVISIIEAVVPYADEAAQSKIRQELQLFSADQNELHRKASGIAERWLQFEMDLADSLQSGYATLPIQQFIRGLAQEWDSEFALELLRNTTGDGRIRLNRSLAAKLEASKRNTLWVAGGVATGNKRILNRLSAQAAQAIYVNEIMLQTAIRDGADSYEMQQLELTSAKFVARQNIDAGGGCPGSGKGFFGSLLENPESPEGAVAEKSCVEVKNGQSVRCPGCKKQVRAIVPNRETIYCSNPQCTMAAPHLKGKKAAVSPKPAADEMPDVHTQAERVAEQSGDRDPETTSERMKQAKAVGELALQA